MSLDDLLQRFSSTLAQTSGLAPLMIAGIAGIVASAVCPCTLPVGLGVAGVAGSSEMRARRTGLLIATAFFLGIVINLAILGAIAGRLGAILTESFGRYWSLGMALLSLAGAAIAFIAPSLSTDQLASLRKPGVLGSFGYGFIFSLGTSAAPLLALLAVAATQASPARGFMLASAFGVGRGLPFLLVAIFAGTVARLARLTLWRRVLQVGSAAALLVVSVYYARVFVALL